MSFITRIAPRQVPFIVLQKLKKVPSGSLIHHNSLPMLQRSYSTHSEKKYTATWIKENRGKITVAALAAGIVAIVAFTVYKESNESVNCRRAIHGKFDLSKNSDTLIEEFNEMLNLLILELIDQKSSKVATVIRQDLSSPESIIMGFLNAMHAKGEYEQINSLLSVILENGWGEINEQFTNQIQFDPDQSDYSTYVNKKPVIPLDQSDSSTYRTHDLITRSIIRDDPDGIYDPSFGCYGSIEIPFTLSEYVVIQELNKRATNGDVNAIRHLILQKALAIPQQERLTELKKMESQWPTNQARAAISYLIKYDQLGLSLKERMIWLEDRAFNHKDSSAADILAEAYHSNTLYSLRNQYKDQLHLRQNEQLEGLLKLVKLGNESAFGFLSSYYEGNWPHSIYVAPLTIEEKQEDIRRLLIHARPHFYVHYKLLETFKLDKRSMELVYSIIRIKTRLHK